MTLGSTAFARVVCGSCRVPSNVYLSPPDISLKHRLSVLHWCHDISLPRTNGRWTQKDLERER